MFDRVWTTLKSLYYSSGPTAEQWASARDKFRPRAAAAKNEADLETVIDEMVAAQPLIKPVITSNGAVVVSGHPLASEAGRLAFEKGGNVVDAMIAVSFALGVVEPEASGIGGDGSAVLFLKGMKKPTTIEYKDMTPIKATPDNPLMVQDGRIVADGPAAANIPGVVAGLDYLYRNYGSGKVKWEDLVAPAIALADDGFILDEGLPSSIAEGRRFLEKWPEATKIYLPDGKVPRPGRSLLQQGLRHHAARHSEGRRRRVLQGRDREEDRRRHGRERRHPHAIADLAQYRAIERAPVAGHYRGHTLYAGGPPLSTGIQLFESLHVLENYQPKPGARASTDPDYLHYLIESWKVRDPLRRVADPERWPVEFEEHLTDAHAKKLFAKIDAKKASRYERTPPDDAPVDADRADAADQHRHDVVRGGRCRRQHDRGDADAEHVGRHVLRVEGARLPLQQSPALESPDRGRVRQPGAADAIVDVGGADAGVREEGVGRRSAEARGGLRRQRVDSAVGLQHHHRRDRRQARRAGGDRSAALPARPRSRRSARQRRAHRDRGSLPARAAART